MSGEGRCQEEAGPGRPGVARLPILPCSRLLYGGAVLPNRRTGLGGDNERTIDRRNVWYRLRQPGHEHRERDYLVVRHRDRDGRRRRRQARPPRIRLADGEGERQRTRKLPERGVRRGERHVAGDTDIDRRTGEEVLVRSRLSRNRTTERRKHDVPVLRRGDNTHDYVRDGSRGRRQQESIEAEVERRRVGIRTVEGQQNSVSRHG